MSHSIIQFGSLVLVPLFVYIWDLKLVYLEFESKCEIGALLVVYKNACLNTAAGISPNIQCGFDFTGSGSCWLLWFLFCIGKKIGWNACWAQNAHLYHTETQTGRPPCSNTILLKILPSGVRKTTWSINTQTLSQKTIIYITHYIRDDTNIYPPLKLQWGVLRSRSPRPAWRHRTQTEELRTGSGKNC